MATVNYSVPDDVKAEFDATFADENKSAIIARLMREAVEDRRRRARRSRAIESLLRIRQRARPRSDRQVARARLAGRP